MKSWWERALAHPSSARPCRRPSTCSSALANCYRLDRSTGVPIADRFRPWRLQETFRLARMCFDRMSSLYLAAMSLKERPTTLVACTEWQAMQFLARARACSDCAWAEPIKPRRASESNDLFMLDVRRDRFRLQAWLLHSNAPSAVERNWCSSWETALRGSAKRHLGIVPNSITAATIRRSRV